MRNSNLPAKLAKPAERALTSAGISTIEQLTDWRESDLKKLHGMGPKALGQLLAALQERGLSFKD
ncbi:DNA-directed RNA polymerase subunit alpha C-terminal domain-containing protein [Fictibacillus phosphorivorans]|uniref:DNA-directed RNA polymerase subunit alpha C-terminal domain-containing protein n=1 Tax=Fictibacillus phosphorivorans TaxID=1221500 RepID=UPI0012935F79|nr:DNA-directed RNA polymerase subunit alpha C-terminal domain-containing protein [Fictibacillus phosphorivorans]MQR96181.1 DNA-binding protein [Fictibacillus phosphorivorans]